MRKNTTNVLLGLNQESNTIRASVHNVNDMNKVYETQKAKKRLEYLRGEIESEGISYGELWELQSLKEYIDPNDTLLLEWAGIPES